MEFTDTVTLDSVRRTADGYLAADARVARTGIQIYSGAEVGKPELRKVRVYRSEDEVFHKDALASFAHRPVTLDHPPVAVTANNWRTYAVGQTGDVVARDKEFVRVPMLAMDADAISAIDAGKRELSMGYDCELKFTPGVTKDGEPYDAIQTRIRGNHIAIVDAGRAGPHCRIGDHQPENEEPEMNLKKITFDGLSIEVTDAGAEVIAKLQGLLTTATAAKDTALAQVATLTTTSATKDAEITTLKQQLVDAKVSPQQMRDAAKAYQKVIDNAKALLPTLTITDAMDELSIRKAVVAAKVGDAAKDWNDEQIATSFATLALGIADKTKDPLRETLIDGAVDMSDAQSKAEAAREKAIADTRNAYKTPAAA